MSDADPTGASQVMEDQTMFKWLLAVIAATFLIGAAGAEPVNINTAEPQTIARELKGIGLSRARAIVEWRRKNGDFESLADLLQVKGVGPKIVELNRGNIRFAEPES